MEEKNNVNHPSHYNRDNAMECIDEMEMIFGEEAVMNFCLCNCWKYRYRAADKNGEEDIAKSDWYLNKYKELKDASERSIRSMITTSTMHPTICCDTTYLDKNN